jgi:hypothetical protein
MVFARYKQEATISNVLHQQLSDRVTVHQTFLITCPNVYISSATAVA